MKDKILSNYVDDFKAQYKLEEFNDAEIFERFVNFCVISKQYPRDFDFENLSVGGSNDIGFDGAAFIVNGNIIQSPEEVDYLLKKNGSLLVSFSFIQSKSSSKFKGDQIGTLIFGLKTFFDDTPSIPENDDINNLRRIKEKIYQNTISLEKAPSLDIYFVTTGEWKNPEHITGRVERELKELRENHLFSNIVFNFIDAEKLKQSYREINRKTIREIEFNSHIALPDINNVRQSFVGSIPANEYLKLICDSEGKLQKNLFEDNVRDFQGNNKVNKEIAKTLNNPIEQSAVPVFNNGITIIAKKVELISKKLKLTDYQIVNGCQSSHVLFENKDKLSDNTHIIIKVIETTDYDFASKVIQATNRQTEVKDEAFESLSPFHQDLEEFYKAHSKKITNPIFYERRSKQFESDPSIKPTQVITLAAQINSYVATQLDQPHSTHRYYGELLEANRSKMFKSNTKLDPYYIASLTLNRIETAFKRNKISRFYRKFKYQILFLSYDFFMVKRNKIKDYNYSDIINELNDMTKCCSIFNAATKLISKELDKIGMSPFEAVRSKNFTRQLKDEFKRQS